MFELTGPNLYRQIWQPSYPMAFVVPTIVEVIKNIISLKFGIRAPWSWSALSPVQGVDVVSA